MGVDDSPFKFDDKKTLVAAVVVRAPAYVESVLKTEVDVDGIDSTEKIIEMIERCRHKDQLKAIMIDGASLGGFNVIDVEKIYSESNIPIITITRDHPDFDAMKQALMDHFKDWEFRWAILSKGELSEVKTTHTPIYMKTIGITKDEAVELIKLSTVRGVLPEPIRLAHLIASGITTGESTSKA